MKFKIIYLILILIIPINFGFTKDLESVNIAYIEIENDSRYDPDVAYTRIQLKPTGRPFAGALVAYGESEKLFDILGKEIEISRFVVKDNEEILNKIKELVSQNTHFFIIDADSSFFKKIPEFDLKNIAIFNITEPDDSLRQENCDSRVFHTIPSYSMLSDALAQYLVFKNWKKILLLKGPYEEDTIIADSFINSSNKYGLDIIETKDFILSNDPRKREENNLALLTIGKKYDVIYLADSDGEFGRYLPYSTKNPNLVIGSTGLTAETWHWSFERHGAPQLNSRFADIDDSRRMSNFDWAAWAAVNTIFKSSMKSKSVDSKKIIDFFKSDKFGLDGFKGPRLSFRLWDNQMRQPILLSTHNALIYKTPIEGFLHEKNDLDTLGSDELETRCSFTNK
tara:strand:- start:3757 stop:4944 length:1188 start_codon:yes stop_codon:yes gene_type:complete